MYFVLLKKPHLILFSFYPFCPYQAPWEFVQERNVKDPLGDMPFVLGLCMFLQSDSTSEAEKPTSSNTKTSKVSIFTLLSRLSFCFLVTEAPLQTYLLKGFSLKGLPLVRSDRADPIWEQLLLGPGLILAHGVCALLLFLMVQRPLEAFLSPITRLGPQLLLPLLPIYVAFLAYHSGIM